MKKLIWAVLAVLALSSASSHAADASLSMVYTNALGSELPFSIFSKNSWSPDAKARFVKLHLYFDEPIMVKGLEIDTCGSGMDPRLSIFFNFDQWIFRTKPALEGEVPEALYPVKKGNLLALEGFKKVIEVRSLTFNFERNSNFRICGIHVKDPKGQNYSIKTPALVTGGVEASSTLAPKTAYDPIYLFDSRFEYGWASNKQAKNVALTFSFDETRRVERIRLWNGYQRSVTHCVSNSRARKIRVTGEGDYSEVIEVKDVLGSQVIALPKPYEGKQLKFEIFDSFPGKSYPDLVISEVRFFDGKEWFMLDPTAKLKEGMEANRAEFDKAQVRALLNDSYRAETTTEKEMEAAANWLTSTLRLRADGSFYISGEFEDGNNYFALGNYEIKGADKVKGLKLRLFGLYYESQVYGDCNGCGRDCNKNNAPEDGAVQKIFQEIVTIKPARNGRFEVLNESGGKKIHFKRLEFSRER